MDQFYAIVTGEEDAFFKVCMALPDVINEVLSEDDTVSAPNDTVIGELKNIAVLCDEPSDELSMAMAVYLLGFSTYMGFADKLMLRSECEKNIEKDSMLNWLYEYAKRL